jgi:hypothetical protein
MHKIFVGIKPDAATLQVEAQPIQVFSGHGFHAQIDCSALDVFAFAYRAFYFIVSFRRTLSNAK